MHLKLALPVQIVPIAQPLPFPPLFEDDIYHLNGRILKPYYVNEHIPDDIPFYDHLPTIIDSYLSKPEQLLLSHLSSGRFHHPFTARHGNFAVGSGNRGVFRNQLTGQYVLGSGSLGYVSGRDRYLSLIDARLRKGLPADPLNFGHGSIHDNYNEDNYYL